MFIKDKTILETVIKRNRSYSYNFWFSPVTYNIFGTEIVK